MILLILCEWLNMRVCVSLCVLLTVKRHHGHWQITWECSIAGCCVLLSLGSSVTGCKASWEAGGGRSEGVTPPMDDDHTGAPAKTAAGPVLLLWSFGIPLSHRQFQGNNIVALIVLQIAAWNWGVFPSWTHYSSAFFYLPIFWRCVVLAPNLR